MVALGPGGVCLARMAAVVDEGDLEGVVLAR